MPDFVTNSWRPDSCNCEINYFFPRDSPGKIQYLSPKDHVPLLPEVFAQVGPQIVNRNTGRVIVETVCQDHSGLSGKVLYDTLVKESSSKEIAYVHYVETLGLCGSCSAPVVDGKCRQCGETAEDCGQLGVCRSRRDFLFRWEFDKDRVLTVRFRNATPTHLSAIKSKVDGSLGHNRTLVRAL